MTTKFIVRHNGEIIGTRKSAANRIYTHAVAVWGHGKTAKVVTWCGRPDLAVGEKRKYQRYGYTAEILPVEQLQPKAKVTPKDIEKALHDRFPGLKDKLVVI